VALTLTNGLSLVAAAGFWFHTSQHSRILFGKYSIPYFLALCLLTVLATIPGATLRFLLTEQALILSSGRKVTLSLSTKLLTVLVLAAVLLGSAETLLVYRYHAREARAPDLQRQQFHPYLQVVPKPNHESLVINRWGFRGEDIERVKPANVYRIFVLGGSTVFCPDVAFEDSHCRILEKKLRSAYPGVKVEVQNAGMDWHTSQHSLMTFLSKFQDFDPDLIICLQGINDLCRSFSPPGFAWGDVQRDYSHYYGPVATMVNDYFGAAAYHRFLIISEVCSHVAYYWYSDFRYGTGPKVTQEVKPVAVTQWQSLAPFERNMRDLATVIRSKQIELVLVSQPYLYKTNMTEEEERALLFPDYVCRNKDEKPDLASMVRGMDTFNRTSKAIAHNQGVLFIDLEQLVPKTLEYFVDDVHYTVEGNRLIGEILARNVIAAGFVARKFPKAGK
jgi:hypothetical protein